MSAFSGYSLNKRLNNLKEKQQEQKRSAFSGYSKYGTSYRGKNSGSTLGYLGGSMFAGLAGVVEGVADITAAAGALLVGDKEYAKYVFKDNVVGDWHQSLTENYNPGAVMQFAGDVAHGLGQSSVFLLDAVGVPVGTVGFFAGMVGQGISGAAEKKGDVGFKEIAYGALSGAAEGVLEKALGGTSKAVKNIAGSTFKNVGKNAVRKSLFREIMTDAGQEFLEEFASEYIDVGLQRLTGVDKEASTTLKDAAYSGLVGLFSGAMSAGSSDVIRYAATKQKGAQIIASGNADTLVRTAEMMADKLAGAGTNFKNTADWIRNLRADVDAYNKLNAEQKVGAKGQAILGELHAVVGMSELQTILGGVQEAIQNESFETREMLAEYINQSVDKSKRKKDYTAEDVSDNTDNIATQLAVLKAVGLVDLDGAIADAMRESAITSVIDEERAAAAEPEAEEAETGAEADSIVPETADIVPENGEPVAQAEGIVPENESGAVEGFAEAEASPAEGTQYSISTSKAARRKMRENAARAEKLHAEAVAGNAENLAQEARKDSEEQTSADDVESKAEAEEATESGAEKREDDSPKATAEAVAENATTKADEKADESGEAEPKINEAKEILTIEQKREKAKERARKWVEWEKRTAPKVAELNAAREAVKGFDDLDIPKRMAIVRMLRSAEEAEAKVDPAIVKGVANIMAANPKSDLDFRFADGVGENGLTTHIGGRTLIVLNSGADYRNTIRGTIAHELVHYLENRAGYREFAKIVREKAKKEAVERHKKRYEDFYKESEIDYTEADLESEITASLVGDALMSERFLKAYANKDKKFVQRVGSWLKSLVKRLRMDEDAKAEADLADEHYKMVATLLQLPEVGGERSGKKYSTIQKDGKYYTPTDEELIKKHPFIKEVAVKDAMYSPGLKLSDDEYKAYRKKQKEAAAKNFGVYTNQDTAYSNEYGLINAEFGNMTVRKGNFHGGVALYDIFPHIPQIFENAIVLNTKTDRDGDTNIKGVVDLVGCATLNDKYIAVVKLNVKEYVNDEAKIYDNKVLTIEELTVVERVGHQDAKASSDSTSSAVSSKYIIAQYRKLVKGSDNKNIEKSDLSTPTGKKYDLADGRGKPKKAKPKTERHENPDVALAAEIAETYANDPFFAGAVVRSFRENARAEAKKAQNEAEAFKAENKRRWEEDQRKKETIRALAQQVADLEDMLNLLSAQNNELRKIPGDLVNMREEAKRRYYQMRERLNEVLRENRDMKEEVEAALKEANRVAKMYGNLSEGKVFENAEIARAVDEIAKNGLLDYFAGKFETKLVGRSRDEIVRYMAIQLNTGGLIGGDKITSLIARTAREMINSMVMIDEETGQKHKMSDYFGEDQLDLFAEDIRDDLTNAISSMGHESTYADLQRKISNIRNTYFLKEAELKDEIERFKADERSRAFEQKQIGIETPKTYQAALKLKHMAEVKQGIGGEAVEHILKELGKVVDESGHLHLGRIDQAMRDVVTFFEGEALKLQSAGDQIADGDKMTTFAWGLDPNLRAMAEHYLLTRKDNPKGALTSEQLKLAGDVFRGMKKMLETYNKEYIGNRYVDIDAAAGELIRDLQSIGKNKKEPTTKVGELLGSALKWAKEEYVYKVLSPETVVDALEGYKKNGTLHTLYRAVREARINADDLAVKMKDPFAKFVDAKENRWVNEDDKERSFRDKLNEKEIVVNGGKITLGEAIYLYMLTKRDHAHRGLKESGYITYDDKGKKKLTIKVEDPTGTRSEIGNQLDATDRKFLAMAEEFFNVTATKVKYEADMKIFGYTNNQPGYYVPIVRDRYSRVSGVTDARQGIDSIATVYSPSFTQNLVTNAKALEGQSILRLINDHADGLGAFSELYIPLKAFDRVYNHGVLTEEGVKTIREVLNEDVWKGTHEYFKDVFQDIQGQRKKSSGTVDQIVGTMRSAWVNSVLGANLKVVTTQTTSLAAATQVIEPKYITRAISVLTPGRDMSELGERANKYSRIIQARSFDMGALKAQGNIDKVSSFGEKAGYLIGWMDRRVCLSIFHAAEIKVAETQGFEIGSEENAKRAAKIADDTIYTTQAMDSMAEKSALQRDTSEIAKLFSMFTSDTVKNLSHLYGNVMKYVAHKERAKTDKSYEAELKKDAAEMKRSIRTLAVTGVMLGLITQAFKYIYGTEEEEPEEKAKDFALDIFGSTFNVLPVVSDVVDKLVFDYDLSLNVLDVANDTLEALRDGFSTAGKAMRGEYVSAEDGTKVASDILRSALANVGLPVSPAEKTVMAVVRRLSPRAGYTWDDWSNNMSYTADLKAAVANGDERLAEHVLGRLYRDQMTGDYSAEELEEVVRLYGAGYTGVLPQRIGEEVNGVKLNKQQRKQFNAIYAEASDKVTAMIRSDAFYALSDEQRAKAIKNLYAFYYSRAASEVTGKEWTNAQAYAQLISDPTVLFVAQAYKSGLEAIKNADGKEVTVKQQFVDYAQNLGLSDEAYTVIAYANGVRDKKTRADILKYINSLGLDEETKTRIAERLGFVIKNGAVSEDDA